MVVPPGEEEQDRGGDENAKAGHGERVEVGEDGFGADVKSAEIELDEEQAGVHLPRNVVMGRCGLHESSSCAGASSPLWQARGPALAGISRTASSGARKTALPEAFPFMTRATLPRIECGFPRRANEVVALCPVGRRQLWSADFSPHLFVPERVERTMRTEVRAPSGGLPATGCLGVGVSVLRSWSYPLGSHGFRTAQQPPNAMARHAEARLGPAGERGDNRPSGPGAQAPKRWTPYRGR